MSSNLLQIQGGKRVTEKLHADGLVCVFHGYGANRENLYDVAVQFSNQMPSYRFILPNGIQRFEGMGDGYQWFSLRDFTQQYMQKGLESVAPKIAGWIKNRLDELNLSDDQLYLAGFSQGAMLSLYLAASGLIISPQKVLAFSGLFIPPKQSDSQDKKTKILAINGDADHVVPLNMSNTSYTLLKMHGLNNIKFIVEKSVEHYISPKGISEGINFLKL